MTSPGRCLHNALKFLIDLFEFLKQLSYIFFFYPIPVSCTVICAISPSFFVVMVMIPPSGFGELHGIAYNIKSTCMTPISVSFMISNPGPIFLLFEFMLYGFIFQETMIHLWHQIEIFYDLYIDLPASALKDRGYHWWSIKRCFHLSGYYLLYLFLYFVQFPIFFKFQKVGKTQWWHSREVRNSWLIWSSRTLICPGCLNKTLILKAQFWILLLSEMSLKTTTAPASFLVSLIGVQTVSTGKLVPFFIPEKILFHLMSYPSL